MVIIFECDYCGQPLEYERPTRPFESGTVRHGGSDYLAVWCDMCGPKHREEG